MIERFKAGHPEAVLYFMKTNTSARGRMCDAFQGSIGELGVLTGRY